jgi:hypothetical protein
LICRSGNATSELIVASDSDEEESIMKENNMRVAQIFSCECFFIRDHQELKRCRQFLNGEIFLDGIIGSALEAFQDACEYSNILPVPSKKATTRALVQHYRVAIGPENLETLNMASDAIGPNSTFFLGLLLDASYNSSFHIPFETNPANHLHYINQYLDFKLDNKYTFTQIDIMTMCKMAGRNCVIMDNVEKREPTNFAWDPANDRSWWFARYADETFQFVFELILE